MNVLIAFGAAIWLLGTVGGIDYITNGQASVRIFVGFLMLFGAWIGEAYRRVFSEEKEKKYEK